MKGCGGISRSIREPSDEYEEKNNGELISKLLQEISQVLTKRLMCVCLINVQGTQGQGPINLSKTNCSVMRDAGCGNGVQSYCLCINWWLRCSKLATQAIKGSTELRSALYYYTTRRKPQTKKRTEMKDM